MAQKPAPPLHRAQRGSDTILKGQKKNVCSACSQPFLPAHPAAACVIWLMKILESVRIWAAGHDLYVLGPIIYSGNSPIIRICRDIDDPETVSTSASLLISVTGGLFAKSELPYDTAGFSYAVPLLNHMRDTSGIVEGFSVNVKAAGNPRQVQALLFWCLTVPMKFVVIDHQC